MIRQRVRDADSGVTLVELLVVMVVMGVVSILMTGAVIATQRNDRFNEDEAIGLTDVRKVVERLGRDLRQARGIDEGATESRLVLWIDYDSDYRKDADEIVTWSLVPSKDAGHWDVVRTIAGVSTYRQATTLIDDLAFEYAADLQSDGSPKPLALPLSKSGAQKVRIVSTSIHYDAVLGSGSAARTVEFSSRLRNVG